MPIRIDDPAQQSCATLVTGILDDLQSLVHQQLRLTMREIEVELRRRIRAIGVITFGVGLSIVSAVAFSMAAANFTHWSACPEGTDPAPFPLWACHTAVSLAFAIAGGVVLFVGLRRLRCSMNCRIPAIEFKEEKSLNG